MHSCQRILLTVVVVAAGATAAMSQTAREDAIWARTVPAGTITLDGVLNEAAWAAAESVHVVFGENSGLPGGGWHQEGTAFPSDPTNAWVKFLVSGDSLYVAIIARDSSVGGGPFNRKDVLLMNLRDKMPTGSPGTFINPLYSRSFEFFYGWWDSDPASLGVGADPSFFGFAGGHRDSIQAARTDYPNVSGLVKRMIWDAATTVQGVANSDTASDGTPAYDQGYTVELKFNAGLRGYSPSTGDTIMWSVSIYDGDWRWPVDSTKMTGNRVWLQCPWGNASQHGHMNILADPSVTTSSALPGLPGPDVVVRNGQNYPNPVIDGMLDDEVWQYAPSIMLEYGNDAVREAYPNAGKYRSGQYQLPHRRRQRISR